jgi:hypothetical protein
MAGLRWWFCLSWNRGRLFMLVSKDDIAEQNFRITDNNAIDMHVGKGVRLRHTLLA